MTVQWLPAHCGLSGNERADGLAKKGSTMDQPSRPLSFSQAKTIIKSHFWEKWREGHAGSGEDGLKFLGRGTQTVIFRLRTGHCRLAAHMYRMGLSPTPECMCGTGQQNPAHLLQDCPTFRDLRQKIWPKGATLEEKLWGGGEQLEKTAAFVEQTGLAV